jgi:DivIVA domain-containing protein
VDRDAIERRDFPIGRRGYDQAAVDAHLRQVADELESLRRRAPAAPPPASLAAGTSEQVRVILEAAEASAAELRADAGRQAGEHVAEVQRAAGGMLSRLDELERELGTLLDALRTSGERLTEGLARLHEQASGLGAAAAPGDHAESLGDDPASRPAPPEEDFAAAAPAELDSSTAAPAELDPSTAAPASADSPPATADDLAGSPAGDDGATSPASGRDDEAGARLIALNMALSGTPREETARYLAEHFELADADALLDDVYARAGE